MSAPIMLEVYRLEPAPLALRASHTRVTHYAQTHSVPVPDPRKLGGEVVRIDGQDYQVLGVQVTDSSTIGLALRRVLKVGRG